MNTVKLFSDAWFSAETKAASSELLLGEVSRLRDRLINETPNEGTRQLQFRLTIALNEIKERSNGN